MEVKGERVNDNAAHDNVIVTTRLSRLSVKLSRLSVTFTSGHDQTFTLRQVTT